MQLVDGERGVLIKTFDVVFSEEKTTLIVEEIKLFLLMCKALSRKA